MSTIVIGGGVGPAAGVQLHQKIIEWTDATGDPTHLDVLHASCSRRIPDRTAFLLGKDVANPGSSMAAVLSQISPNESSDIVVGVPCNTFHSHKVWTAFEDQMRLMWPEARLVHMVRETAMYLKKNFGDGRVGLMSTTGTRATNVYPDLLEDVDLVQVDNTTQDKLQDTIYSQEYGLKSVYPASARARENFESFADELVDAGASALILGCTEIPFAFPGMSKYRGVPLVDPVEILARALVFSADSTKLREHAASALEFTI
eukprot:g2456.t1